jgi:hypothetical protein
MCDVAPGSPARDAWAPLAVTLVPGRALVQGRCSGPSADLDSQPATGSFSIVAPIPTTVRKEPYPGSEFGAIESVQEDVPIRRDRTH